MIWCVGIIFLELIESIYERLDESIIDLYDMLLDTLDIIR